VTGTRQILGAVVAIVRQFPTATPTIPHLTVEEEEEEAESEASADPIYSNYAAPAMA
jgi:hypothetical protein